MALFSLGKHRTQSSSVLNLELLHCQDKLEACSSATVGWRNSRVVVEKVACNCGEARVSVSDRGLGGAEPTMLDVDCCVVIAGACGTTGVFFNRFFIWLSTPS